MTILNSDVEPLSKYSPVTLHLSPATRILNDNPDEGALFISNKRKTRIKVLQTVTSKLGKEGIVDRTEDGQEIHKSSLTRKTKLTYSWK